MDRRVTCPKPHSFDVEDPNRQDPEAEGPSTVWPQVLATHALSSQSLWVIRRLKARNAGRGTLQTLK